MLKIHGVTFSTHTRKVIITALEKGLPYELVETIPLKPPPGWKELSPLGLIPVLEDDRVRLTDSSVIGLYLEHRYPERPFYPQDSTNYAHALWIEEFVDGGLARHVLHGVLLQRVFAPLFLKQPPNQALIDESLNELIPPKLDYLENSLESQWFAGDAFSIADVAVASILLNYHYAGESLDAARYPGLGDFLKRACTRDSFRTAFAEEVPAARRVEALDLSLFGRLGY